MAYHLVVLNEDLGSITTVKEIDPGRVAFYDRDAELRHHPYACVAFGEEEPDGSVETYLLVGPDMAPEAAAAEYMAGEYIRD